MVGGPVEGELATPTGVSIVVNLVDRVLSFPPLMRPMRFGFGAGTMEFEGFSNALPIVLGESLYPKLVEGSVYLLETNVDDASGEVVGYALERLREEGALDACVIPMYGKKSRPGHIVRVMCGKGDVERFARILVSETGTLGVRVMASQRLTLPRRVVAVEVDVGGVMERVRVKVSKDLQGRVIYLKPEYEDVERISSKMRRPLREVFREVEAKALKALKQADRQRM